MDESDMDSDISMNFEDSEEDEFDDDFDDEYSKQMSWPDFCTQSTTMPFILLPNNEHLTSLHLSFGPERNRHTGSASQLLAIDHSCPQLTQLILLDTWLQDDHRDSFGKTVFDDEADDPRTDASVYPLVEDLDDALIENSLSIPSMRSLHFGIENRSAHILPTNTFSPSCAIVQS